MTNKLLLTGASGFVGKSFLRFAASRGIDVCPVYRSKGVAEKDSGSIPGARVIQEFSPETDWRDALQGINVILHCAAQISPLKNASNEEMDKLFQSVNVDATLNLARQAAETGVQRFIFLSTIKVNGEGGNQELIYSADDSPAPEDRYGQSKAEAEAQLRILGAQTGMEICIIRAPMIYGPGVKGNFAKMISAVKKGMPLPLGNARSNLRSLVAIDNLISLLVICMDHPLAADQTFLVSDGVDLSTAEMLKRIGEAFQRPVVLLPVPMAVLYFLARVIGKEAMARRLFGSLRVDIEKTRNILGWRPVVSIDGQLKIMAGLEK